MIEKELTPAGILAKKDLTNGNNHWGFEFKEKEDVNHLVEGVIKRGENTVSPTGTVNPSPRKSGSAILGY